MGTRRLSLFDLVSVSLYRSGRNQATYTDRLRNLVRDHAKLVAITEFGCGAFTGADQRGAGSFQIVNWFSSSPHIRGDHPRDEAVQAQYLGELIGQYNAEGVHGCFVFTFAMPDFLHHDDPRLDLDEARFGVVAVTGDGPAGPRRLSTKSRDATPAWPRLTTKHAEYAGAPGGAGEKQGSPNRPGSSGCGRSRAWH